MSYSEEYAGAYINDDNNLVMLIKEGTQYQTLLNPIDSEYQDNILFETASYSMNELEQLSSNVVGLLEDVEIEALTSGINEMDNKAFVYVLDGQTASALQLIPTAYDINELTILIGSIINVGVSTPTFIFLHKKSSIGERNPVR